MPRKKKFTPEQLEKEINNYFNYIDQNPFIKKKVRIWNGKEETNLEYLPRPYTLEGLYTYLKITKQTFHNYLNEPEYFDLLTHVRNRIDANKLEGGLSNLFHGNLAAMSLGLKNQDEIRQNNTLINIDPSIAKGLLESFANKYGTIPVQSTTDKIEAVKQPEIDQSETT